MNHEYYYDWGLQYYVTGRFSFFCSYTPITGILFHHAIEMFLKGKLIDSGHAEDSLWKDYGHSLHKLWNEFVKLYDASLLNEYSPLIQKLDKWEDIRYPPSGRSYNMVMFSSEKKVKNPGQTYPKVNEKDKYIINSHEIDGLIAKLFEIIPINPRYFVGTFHKDEAKDFYEKENNSVIDFGFNKNREN